MNWDKDGKLKTCVAVSPQGRACPKLTTRQAPFPLCFDHAFEVYLYVHSDITYHLRSIHDTMAAHEKGPTPEQKKKAEELRVQRSVVYYVRIEDYIKIGFTENMTERMKQLRVEWSAVMATEPGGREKERERHEQFADIRRGRKENFEKSPDLLTHIAKVRREHGAPKKEKIVAEYRNPERGPLFRPRVVA